ncbi:TetR family transcriptional regulator [Sediminibacillus dalangtanensis]|uniref:TetR family transcriptional regulator n=2 Tax=Sediminibacillus dalangtanensis TaxID=2729421 RepID=A0ABX7VS54_9BACI|nr:TetR family transcriptional regulator [Sediminibacillus dalangtanensis]
MTSIQEIALETGVSKGAFYKHFASKEALLIELVKDCHNKMFLKAHSVQVDGALTGKELLQKRIEIELEQTRKNSSILFTLFKEFPPGESNEISQMMKEFHMKLIQWHKQCLIEAFGDSDAIWDIVVMFEGILKEYISLLVFKQTQVPVGRLAHLLTDVLESMINRAKNLEPILNEETVLPDKQNDNPAILKQQLHKLMESVRQEAETLLVPDKMKNDTLAALNHLSEEIQKDKPQIYLLDALIDYLKQQDCLVSSILQIEHTLNRLLREEGEDR